VIVFSAGDPAEVVPLLKQDTVEVVTREEVGEALLLLLKFGVVHR
jgi:hypothetical protein